MNRVFLFLCLRFFGFFFFEPFLNINRVRHQHIFRRVFGFNIFIFSNIVGLHLSNILVPPAWTIFVRKAPTFPSRRLLPHSCFQTFYSELRHDPCSISGEFRLWSQNTRSFNYYEIRLKYLQKIPAQFSSFAYRLSGPHLRRCIGFSGVYRGLSRLSVCNFRSIPMIGLLPPNPFPIYSLITLLATGVMLSSFSVFDICFDYFSNLRHVIAQRSKKKKKKQKKTSYLLFKKNKKTHKKI